MVCIYVWRQDIRRLRWCSRSCFRIPRPSSAVVSCQARFSGSGVPVLPNLDPRRSRVVVDLPPADHRHGLARSSIFTLSTCPSKYHSHSWEHLYIAGIFRHAWRIWLAVPINDHADKRFGPRDTWKAGKRQISQNTAIHRSHSFLVAYDSHVKYFSQHYWFIWFSNCIMVSPFLWTGSFYLFIYLFIFGLGAEVFIYLFIYLCFYAEASIILFGSQILNISQIRFD
jgi:hypothetical protein